jgi:hypothetical protein
MGEYMKQSTITIIVLMLTLILTGCGNTAVESINDSDVKQIIITESENAEVIVETEKEEVVEEKTEEVKTFDHNAYIGQDYVSVQALLGTPNDSREIDASTVMEYHDDISLVVELIENDILISQLYYTGTDQIFGLTNGMPMLEVVGVLGIPKYSGTNEFDEYKITYEDVDGFNVICVSDGAEDGNLAYVEVRSNVLDSRIADVNAAKYQAEAAVQSEYIHLSADGLALESCEAISGDWVVTITGVIRNTTNKDLEGVGVTFLVFDVDGNIIEESIDYIGTLRANATWKYEALIMSDNADRFELAEITNW